jgi:hypothetical protein
MELSQIWSNTRISQILWNPKAHYRVHKSPPLVPIWPRWIQSIPPSPIPLRSILTLSTHLRLRLPSGLFPSNVPTNILLVFIFYSFVLYAMPTSSFLNWSFGEECNLTNLFRTQFSPTFCHFNSLQFKYSPQHPVLKHPWSGLTVPRLARVYCISIWSCTLLLQANVEMVSPFGQDHFWILWNSSFIYHPTTLGYTVSTPKVKS